MQTIRPSGGSCVDHIFCIQIECRSDGGTAGLYVTGLFPSFQQSRPRLLMNCGVHPGIDPRIAASRVHDGIHLHIVDIVADDFKWHNASPFEHFSYRVSHLSQGVQYFLPILSFFVWQ